MSSDHDDRIPDLACAWASYPHVVSTVRRPSPLPDPASYHELIAQDAIFQLDEKQADGSTNTVLVVPFSCARCRAYKVACSRARPLCTRCRNAGVGTAECEPLQEGYQKLPGPKVGRNGGREKGVVVPGLRGMSTSMPVSTPATRAHSSTRESESTSASVTLDEGRRRPGHVAPQVASGSKRPLSPGSDSVPPRKKTAVKAKTEARKKKGRRSMDEDVRAGGSAQGALSTDTPPSTVRWSFICPQRTSGERTSSDKDNTLVPRVWTNSLGTLLTVFPELGKSAVGFSWFQFETPVLLLHTNYAQGHWTSNTTLHVDLLWDFSCCEHELEPDVASDVEESAQPCSSRPGVQSPLDTHEHEAEKMDSSTLYSRSGSVPIYESVSAPMPRRYTRMLPSNGIPPDTCQGGSLTHEPSNLSSPLSSLPPDPEPRIPLIKPPEVETLLDSHTRFIPLLLWMSHDSGLVPRDLSSEHAYTCMGLFFISDLHHAVVLHDVSSTPGRVLGRVCWSVTLEWAPGGEDALFDCSSSPSTSELMQVEATRDLLHPWWYDPTGTPSQTEEVISYRPRDLRLQFFSFIPLDFLAEFHPSESFPRGWFCKSCGMINPQLYFRHQLCQSTRCRAMRDKHVPAGKIDPLSKLRDPYQCSVLIRPTAGIPTAVVSDCVTWDDGMQSWVYEVKDGVSLCHVFTRNEKRLQGDATALFEKIQCEVLLLREADTPYFIHRTKLTHPSDGSEAMVPMGTPQCMRTAYYTLCDFVHRYGEREMPRFGEVRVQAWVATGSKKGHVFRASTSPVVIHCLGAEVGLNLTPKGGYRDTAKSNITPDKGKGRAVDDDREGSPSTVSRTGPPHYSTSSMSELEAGKPPSVAENVDNGNAAMDTEPQCSNQVAGNSNTGPEKEVANPERRGRKQKCTKDKNKASVPEICMTLVHGDGVVLFGDDFECQIVRTGTTILVIGFPEER